MSTIEERFRTAKDLYDKKEYIRAKEIFQDIEYKSMEAAYYLAIIYRKGLDTEANYDRAIEYYKKSMKMGNSEAKAELATMYMTGQGVKRDVEQAHKMLEEARYEGSVVALDNLGMMYESGIGVPMDLDMAMKYYNSATDLGSLNSAYQLARMYYFGKGVEKNLDRALTLLQYAKEKPEAAYLLGMMYHKGEVEAVDDSEAWKLLNYASDAGCSAAMCQLAVLLINGVHNGETNISKAKALLERAKKQGSKKAQELLDKYKNK